MPTLPQVSQLHEVLALAYAGSRFVGVASVAEAASIKTLNPEGLNGTNHLKLFVFGNESNGQARLVALLDNLGKGASGAAVQNLNLMLDLDEGEGLI
jgi:N-acetyl-gamma-glutamyl-phosphate reductase